MYSNTSNNSEVDTFEETSKDFKKYKVLPMSIIFGIGFLANSMVLFNGIRRRKMIKHFSNYFVLSMTVADWSVLVFTVPMMFVEYLVGLKWMPNFVCTYILTVRETFQGAAIFSITTLAVLRCRQVMTNPIRQFSNSACKKLVAGIWIISFLTCTLPLYNVYSINDIGICDPVYVSITNMRIHLTSIVCILLVPILVATVAYSAIIARVISFLGSDTDSDRAMKKNRSIAMLLVLLILSCWISYTPLAAYLMIKAYGNDIQINEKVWDITVVILFIGGSALNPILVLLTMPKDYRSKIKCRTPPRVGVQEQKVEQKESAKSSIPLM